jgi:endonuclease YncB( thermonuclease family)
VAGAVLLIAAHQVEAKWETYEDCELIESEYFDGDSFHVMYRERKHYIFRLHFVDTPETDESLEDRIVDQAEYWDIDEKNTVKLGKAATKFTAEFLKDGFTVYTEKKKARGRSDRQRYYAMLKVGDEYLSEALVRAGLARIYGKMTDLHDGTKMEKYLDQLQDAERDAKKSKLGAWNPRSTPRAPRRRIERPTIEEQDMVLASSIGIYSLKNSMLLGVLRAGREIRVLKAVSFSMVRIRFDADGKRYEAQCQRSDLGL